MPQSSMTTPGVFISEKNAFPNSVVPVATSVPAFIGYTPQALYQGQSYFNKAQKITSFAEFKTIYCLPDPPLPAPPARQYNPQYYLVKQQSQSVKDDYVIINGTYYSNVPDPATVYYLYNSVRLFYENGGGDAYIVAVGTYGPASGVPAKAGENIVNPNVQLTELLAGLELLKSEQEPTLYLCPEATLLTLADNSTLMQAMLLQCGTMQTAISIFDVIGARDPDPLLYIDDIATFRVNVGNINLNYGAAYYPFIGTTVMQNSEIDYTNLFGGDIKQLAPIINAAAVADPAVNTILANIENAASGLTVTQNNNALLNASKAYADIMKNVLADANVLPACGAIAGIITTTDNMEGGPWKAAANVAITGAASLPIRLTDEQQEPLSTDAVSGKSINAIRFFTGLGILVWGGRTLDANSQDWRYLSVRRTSIFIEQSCKLAAQAYAFEPNDNNTWQSVIAAINSFLTNIWKEGGLAGPTAADAFSVDCGLGSTMTADDVLNGQLIVTVKVAIMHPAEFIVITFQQQMVR
jgi:uncharacterized protein